MKTLLKTMPLLVVLCLAVFVFPNQALAATEITIGVNTYTWNTNLPTTIAGVTWSSQDTLKLNGANLTQGIDIVGPLTIELMGNNSIASSAPSFPGIRTDSDLIFNGPGSLTISAADGDGISASTKDIFVNSSGSLSVTSTASPGVGITGNLVVNNRVQSVYVKGTDKSVDGIITEPGKRISSPPNPYSYEKSTEQQQQQQQQISREGVVFAMDRDLSYPNGLVFAFHGGYFANFEGVWIHGYAVPEAAYSVDVHNGIAYVFLNRDYLYYALNLAPNEEHLLHVVFSNGYGVTNFTFN